MNPFKLIGILLVLQLANVDAFAQNKYDQQWTIGFYPSFISFTNDSIVFKPLKADFLNFPYGFIPDYALEKTKGYSNSLE
jgi:hypothetical protein